MSSISLAVASSIFKLNLMLRSGSLQILIIISWLSAVSHTFGDVLPLTNCSVLQNGDILIQLQADEVAGTLLVYAKLNQFGYFGIAYSSAMAGVHLLSIQADYDIVQISGSDQCHR